MTTNDRNACELCGYARPDSVALDEDTGDTFGVHSGCMATPAVHRVSAESVESAEFQGSTHWLVTATLRDGATATILVEHHLLAEAWVDELTGVVEVSWRPMVANQAPAEDSEGRPL